MGASSSAPRRVTVENEDTSGVIVMSDSVYSRLKSNLSDGSDTKKGSSATDESKTGAQGSSTPLPLPPSFASSQEGEFKDSSEEGRSKGRECQGLPTSCSSSVPLIQYVEEPSLSALKVKEVKEEELRELEAHYQKRLNDLRDEHDRIANLTDEHFQESLKKIQSLFKAPLKGPVCPDVRQKVINCYENNAERPLVCAESVKTFRNCVRDSRFTSG
uniref:Coiled-coil-helix-coiled-coil-helix domain-containing protein 3, mitochondrial n=1 Tax=Lepeophtheirus salmonis TaxID=72036 RepID=C1BTU1_LEPSM|nr:Coiled-coil-helix-coiled-coil-helix domain-containing protein 3, mitochondrial precursor [Lepeophtheirus salmonis]